LPLLTNDHTHTHIHTHTQTYAHTHLRHRHTYRHIHTHTRSLSFSCSLSCPPPLSPSNDTQVFQTHNSFSLGLCLSVDKPRVYPISICLLYIHWSTRTAMCISHIYGLPYIYGCSLLVTCVFHLGAWDGLHCRAWKFISF